jgi:hypothetical protein
MWWFPHISQETQTLGWPQLFLACWKHVDQGSQEGNQHGPTSWQCPQLHKVLSTGQCIYHAATCQMRVTTSMLTMRSLEIDKRESLVMFYIAEKNQNRI